MKSKKSMGKRVLLPAALAFIFMAGCAVQRPVPYERLQIPAEIQLRLVSGERVDGLAIEKSDESLTLQIGSNKLPSRVDRTAIAEITMEGPLYDEAGRVISDDELAAVRSSRYTVIYTLAGGFLSFGAGLLANSVIARSSDEEFKAINAVSIGAAVVGAVIFNRIGSSRDDRYAVDAVKEQRKAAAQQQLNSEQVRKEKLKQEIDAEKLEKERLEKEKQELEEKLKKKKPDPLD